ncbi:hypothetical protein AAU61_03790 [Desulfocarbo indianensis]|nr:hypothetical protein AAU61_03790 [Desulfocarbo indianensis]
MKPSSRELSLLIHEMIQTSLLAQAMRVGDQWEPRVRGLLVNAADALWHQLRPAVERAASSAAEPERLAELKGMASRLGAEVADKQVERAAKLLEDMVWRELQETLEVLTINGLAREIPSLNLRETVGPELAARLAGGRALSHAVRTSVGELNHGVAALLAGFSGPGADLASLPERFESQVGQWRSRLATIANTVTHAVFNRVKKAATESLG